LTKLFASGKGGWILASEGMEGLCDVAGRSPALAVAARMPLPSMREPLWEALGERIRAGGRNPRHELMNPSAALRLKREFVPLLRKDGLKVIWLLDARASGEGLGSYAARSLDCEPQTAADLEALQAATRAVLSS
jgi:Rad3-related DNA helicase